MSANFGMFNSHQYIKIKKNDLVSARPGSNDNSLNDESKREYQDNTKDILDKNKITVSD